MFGIELNSDPTYKKVEFEDTGVASMVDLSWLQDTSKDFKLDYHFRPNDMRNELGAKVLGQKQRVPKNVNDAALAGIWGSDPEPATDRIKEVIVEFVRRLIAQGYSGNEITKELAARFPVYEVKACAEQLTPIFKWDGIAGHFAVDTGVFEDCAECLDHAKKSRFASHLKYIIPSEKCASCSHCKHKCVKSAKVGGNIDAALNSQGETIERKGCFCDKLGMPFLASDNEKGGPKYETGIDVTDMTASREDILNDEGVKELRNKFKAAHKKMQCYASDEPVENCDYFYSIKPMQLEGRVATDKKNLKIDKLENPELEGKVFADIELKDVDMTPMEKSVDPLRFQVSPKKEEPKAYKVELSEPQAAFKVDDKPKNKELKFEFC